MIFELWCDGSSGDVELEKAMADLMQRKFNLFKRKQRSYGSDNIAALGLQGVFVRVWDKVQRLKNLVWDKQKNPLTDESLEDTWGDIAIYCLMAILVMNKKWPKWKQLDIPTVEELLTESKMVNEIADLANARGGYIWHHVLRTTAGTDILVAIRDKFTDILDKLT